MDTLNRLFISLLIIAFTSLSLSGQYIANWPKDRNLFFSVNPALLTQVEDLSFGINYNEKWQQLSSSPYQSNAYLLLPFRNDKMAFGGHLVSDRTGPFTTTGIAASYAYRLRLGQTREDYVSLGMSLNLRFINFDQEHLTAVDAADELLAGVTGNEFVPPSFAVGIAYHTRPIDDHQRIQFRSALSLSRFFPFQDRFNTLSFDRMYQMYGMVGVSLYVTDEFSFQPTFLLSDIGDSFIHHAVRLTAEHEKYGWAMVQFAKFGIVTTQLGVNLYLGGSEDHLEVSGSYDWNFGTTSQQLGHSFGFSVGYVKKLQATNF